MSSSAVVISKHILDIWVERDKFVAELVKTIEDDREVQALLEMSNIIAVRRLGYNDHGPVHARIVAGTSLEIMGLLLSKGVEFTTLRDGTAKSVDEVKTILVLASYLHDIGNSVHRESHEIIGSILAKDIADRIINAVHPDIGIRRYTLRQEVLSAIFSTEYDVKALTLESSIVKLADGLDMSEGRARLPYKMGKVDMHSISALNIKRVELSPGRDVPIQVSVYMGDLAGFFQVERVLMPKLESSKLKGLVRVNIYNAREELVTSLL
ncbi:HD domain-containing protein [Infirmifilum lucidum]|uniref:HD domain-containing protein n=1 Tax=Infirmifilum lucidum TaxID=2776706 RepID=A0A7L9FIA6_9CREN|nr:HD domain-containing protein [Infirmifilum lucidum]QOJ78495.1 HD domain-containing protein [Infirmifilum lucidum]